MLGLWMVLGFIVGGVLGDEFGAVVGLALGYALGQIQRLLARVTTLEQALASSQRAGAASVSSMATPEVEPASDVAAAAAPSAVNEPPSSPPLSPALAVWPETATAGADGWRAPPAASAKEAFWMPLFRWLTQGNAVAKIGMVVLFFGLGFLLKYAAEHAVLPPSARVGLALLAAATLFALGWWLRGRHRGYALVLQGGGIGGAYLAWYAGFALYGLFPAGVAFALMLMVVVAAAALAVAQDALSLALFGLIGGFLAPILTSTDSGNHVLLFGYYLLLDLGLLLIAWRKAWRVLNLVAFFFTFGVASLWGASAYTPEKFASTEPFLIAFFVLFTATAVLYARQRGVRVAAPDYVQSSLVFGPPLVGFGLQALLVADFARGLELSAFLLGLFYLALWGGLRRALPEIPRLAQSFLALGIGFVSLAVPFALNAQWTSLTWALEGAVLLWLGLRQAQRLSQWAGVGLQLLAGAVFVLSPPLIDTQHPLLDGYFMTGASVGLAGLFSAWLFRRQRIGGALVFAWGLSWWFVVGVVDLAQVPLPTPLMPWLWFTVLTALGLLGLGMRLRDWPALGATPLLFALGLAFLALLALLIAPSPAEDGALWAWVAAAVVFYGALYRADRQGQIFVARAWAEGIGYVALVAVIAQLAIVAWGQVAMASGVYDWPFRIELFGRSSAHWFPSSYGAWPVVWSAAVVLAAFCVLRWPRWPFGGARGRPLLYQQSVGRVLAGALLLWLVAVPIGGWDDPQFGLEWSQPWSWRYVPVLNGPELLALVVLAVLAGRQASLGLGAWWTRALVVLAFALLNAVLARSVAMYAGVDLTLDALSASAVAQTVYSIAWSLVGLGLIVWASRAGRRGWWLWAAALLAVVVLKLFLVDLSGSQTLARVVSFMAVGLLLLAAGYFAPLPEKTASQEPSASG